MNLFNVMVCRTCGAPGNAPFGQSTKCSRCGGKTKIKDILHDMDEPTLHFFFDVTALLGDKFFDVIRNCNEKGCLFRYKMSHVYGKLWRLKKTVGEKKFIDEFPDVYLSMKESRVIEWGLVSEILRKYYDGSAKKSLTATEYLTRDDAKKVKSIVRRYKRLLIDLEYPQNDYEFEFVTLFSDSPIKMEDVNYVLNNNMLEKEHFSYILEKATLGRQ